MDSTSTAQETGSVRYFLDAFVPDLARTIHPTGRPKPISRDVVMYFTILGSISSIETIAVGAGIGKREFKIKRFLEGDMT